MTLPTLPTITTTPRYTSVNAVAPTGTIAIPFPVFGGAEDISVWFDGVEQTAGWSLKSSSGDISVVPRPLTDAYVEFSARTGLIEVWGDRVPRRETNLAESQGPTTRDINQIALRAEATLSELYHVLQRVPKLAQGEIAPRVPDIEDRKGLVWVFDSATGGLTFGVPSTQIIDSGAIVAALGYTPARAEFVRDRALSDVDLYVSPLGSDSNAGTLASPLRTGTAAYNILRDRFDGNGKIAKIKLVGTGQKSITCQHKTTFSTVYVEGHGVNFGDSATWDDVDFDIADGLHSVRADDGARIYSRGFKVQSANGHGLATWDGGVHDYSSIIFGQVEPNNGIQVWATKGGQMEAFGTNLIVGGGGCHIEASHDGRFRITNNSGAGVVSITYATANVTYNVAALYVLSGRVVFTSIRPVGGAFNAAGFTVTGPQFIFDGDAREHQFYGLQTPQAGDMFGSLSGYSLQSGALEPKVLGSVLSPPALTGVTHDWNPLVSGLQMKRVTRIRMSATTPTNLTGLFSDGFANGQMITLQNIGTNAITLKHFDSGSIAADRFFLPGGADIALGAAATITLFFDSSQPGWFKLT